MRRARGNAARGKTQTSTAPAQLLRSAGPFFRSVVRCQRSLDVCKFVQDEWFPCLIGVCLVLKVFVYVFD